MTAKRHKALLPGERAPDTASRPAARSISATGDAEVERIAGYAVHPAAAMFPLMPSAELAELASDIKQHGLRDPIVLYGDQVLDGRNRLRACAIAGIEPTTVEWDGSGGTPEAFAYSVNVLRRHLGEGQRAVFARDLKPSFQAAAAARVKAGKAQSTLPPTGGRVAATGTAAAQAAAVAGVGARSVERADFVARRSPELLEKVRQGEVSLRRAEQEIKRTDQLKAIARYEPPTGRYSVIVADPPWPFDTRTEDDTHRGNCQYPAMTVDQIAAMKVRNMADDNCLLLLWTTAQHLLDHSARRVALAWGFDVRSLWVWTKRTKTGALHPGLGNWGRNVAEFVVVATLGKPIVEFKNQMTVFDGPRRDHSRKPDEFFAIIERCCPATSRLELFAREARPGWERSGAEPDRFMSASPASKSDPPEQLELGGGGP